ncbi:MAG TPA: sigma-70 family RNA polymerase sigma factor [Bacteroidota bacterium]|nr:sigma-70 family RNA polymerase sigma factor [Bacteroidota bacterium]
MREGANTSVTSLVDHLFRHESGRMVSALTRIFGIHNLALAEDVVQEAFLKACQEWRLNPIPPNPSAWLLVTARNRAIDAIRRHRHQVAFSEDITHLLNSEYTAAGTVDGMFLDDEIADSQLRMIFTCCHPALPAEMRIPLTLRTLSGFGIQEIAAALLTNGETITKRLYRARQCIREQEIRFEIPAGGDLEKRLETVYTVLYLLFNEGYNSGRAGELIRKDLCAEAMRLCLLLSQHRVGDRPRTYALLSLMCFHASRFDSRMTRDNEIVLLQDQDRSTWDGELIRRGEYYLGRAAEGEEVSEYHIEAAISAQYALAPSFHETDWILIAGLYDALLTLKANPLVKLNRAVVLGRIHGPQVAIEEIHRIDGWERLASRHYLYNAVLGQLYIEADDHIRARECITRAGALTTSEAEKRLLARKLDTLRPPN